MYCYHSTANTINKTWTGQSTDFFVTDLNHDGISDIVISLKLSGGTNSILELIFSSTATLEYKPKEIVFENRGILKLLGIMDSESHKNSILYLSKAGHLARMINRDPVYISENMIYLNQTDQIDSFFKSNLVKNSNEDFIIGFSGLAIWAYEDKEGWTSKLILDDGLLKITKVTANDFILLYKTKVVWAFSVQAKPKNDEFYWEVGNDVYTFHYKEVTLEQKYLWDDVKITVSFI